MKGVRGLNKAVEMIMKLEKLIIDETAHLKTEGVGSVEVATLTELAESVSLTRRSLELFDSLGPLEPFDTPYVESPKVDPVKTQAREIIRATKVITSEELVEWDTEQIALRLYFLIANGKNMSIDEFRFLGRLLPGIAAQVPYKRY